MIISRIFGGIGNQLFAYSAARRLALLHDAELVIDNVSGFSRDRKYHRHYQLDHFNIPCRKATATERLEPLSRVRRYIKRRLNYRLPFEQRFYIQQEGIDFDPRLLNLYPQGNVYLEGYWQSEDYFKDVAETIRSDLRIKPPTDKVNQEMSISIQKSDSVAVHVRFFDELHETDLHNAPVDYYQRAVTCMNDLVPGAHYYLFSDRPDMARARISIPDERVTFVSHNKGDENAYADLWLMSLCQHFIIANSTFSWWGAWLSENTAKIIIAPGFEKRQGKMSWGFKGLLPEKWIKL